MEHYENTDNFHPLKAAAHRKKKNPCAVQGIEAGSKPSNMFAGILQGMDFTPSLYENCASFDHTSNLSILLSLDDHVIVLHSNFELLPLNVSYPIFQIFKVL